MSNIEKISRGIKELENKSTLTRVVPYGEFIALRDSTVNRRENLQKQADKLADEIAKQELVIEDEFQRNSVVTVNSDTGVKSKLPPQELAVLRKNYNRRKNEIRKEVTKAFRDDLGKARAEIRAKLDVMRESEFLADPHAWATLHEIGSEKRDRMIRDLGRLDGKAFYNAARQAFTSGDKSQIAAICVVNDRKPTKERMLNSKELANVGFGEQAGKISDAIQWTEDSLSRLDQIEMSLVGGHGASREQIKRGLNPLEIVEFDETEE